MALDISYAYAACGDSLGETEFFCVPSSLSNNGKIKLTITIDRNQLMEKGLVILYKSTSGCDCVSELKYEKSKNWKFDYYADAREWVSKIRGCSTIG